jgi:hypothetical protein
MATIRVGAAVATQSEQPGMDLIGRLSNSRIRAMIHELSETGD